MSRPRHFERKGALGPFRRFGARGATFELEFGEASKFTRRAKVKCRSEAEARRLVALWSRWALEAGFAEVALESGTPGILFYLATPLGSGRVRDDEGRNVHFAAAAVAPGMRLKQGQRVVLRGVMRNAKLKASFTFGSKLDAKALLPFPAPRWSEFRAQPDLDAKTRKALLRLAGPGIADGSGSRKLGAAKPGALLYAYAKGVHRLLVREPYDDTEMVFTEPVLDSKLQRLSGTIDMQVAKFCEPIPAALRRELERRLGLGAAPRED